MKKFKVQLLRWWVKDRELTPLERKISDRCGESKILDFKRCKTNIKS